MKAIRIALLALALVLVRQALFAQPATGAVGGSVSASTGAGIPGATVTATNAEAGVARSVTTGPDGEYLIENLPVTGTYELRASLEGFAPVVRSQVSLTPGGRDTIGFRGAPRSRGQGDGLPDGSVELCARERNHVDVFYAALSRARGDRRSGAAARCAGRGRCRPESGVRPVA